MPTTSFTLFKRVSGRLQRFSYWNTLNKELADCRTCLDIGCGTESPVQHLGFEHSVGVEGFALALELAKQRKTHTEFVFANVTELDKHFSAGQFDCCVALDLIEHLTKEDGLKLIGGMERIAKKKILIFTPNGFLHQASHDGDLQEHLSGWSAEEMQSLGFKVLGMYGPKFLRGERHEHRFKPAVFWGPVAAFCHFCWTRRMPKHAAAIICVKEANSRSIQ